LYFFFDASRLINLLDEFLFSDLTVSIDVKVSIDRFSLLSLDFRLDLLDQVNQLLQIDAVIAVFVAFSVERARIVVPLLHEVEEVLHYSRPEWHVLLIFVGGDVRLFVQPEGLESILVLLVCDLVF